MVTRLLRRVSLQLWGALRDYFFLTEEVRYQNASPLYGDVLVAAKARCHRPRQTRAFTTLSGSACSRDMHAPASGQLTSVRAPEPWQRGYDHSGVTSSPSTTIQEATKPKCLTSAWISTRWTLPRNLVSHRSAL